MLKKNKHNRMKFLVALMILKNSLTILKKETSSVN